MRANGIWHPHLVGLLTALGHGDLLVVADPGLPVPDGVPAIDLVWRRGQPPFLPVLEAIVEEAVFEHAVTASELTHPGIVTRLGELFAADARTTVDHEELKRLTAGARAVVRTGEDIPYANVVLRAGVPF